MFATESEIEQMTNAIRSAYAKCVIVDIVSTSGRVEVSYIVDRFTMETKTSIFVKNN